MARRGIVYGRSDQVAIRPVALPAGTTIADAVRIVSYPLIPTLRSLDVPDEAADAKETWETPPALLELSNTGSDPMRAYVILSRDQYRRTREVDVPPGGYALVPVSGGQVDVRGHGWTNATEATVQALATARSIVREARDVYATGLVQGALGIPGGFTDLGYPPGTPARLELATSGGLDVTLRREDGTTVALFQVSGVVDLETPARCSVQVRHPGGAADVRACAGVWRIV